MYVIPMFVLMLVIAVGAVWSPVFALLIAVPLFVLFLAYIGFSRQSDEEVTGPSGAPASGEGESHAAAHHGGIWGEKDAG
jgi:hypothetical protein